MLLATLGTSSVFACLHLGGNTFGVQDVMHLIVSCVCTGFNALCYWMEFDRGSIFSRSQTSPLLLCQTAMMLGY
jgi:uncharacterized membrane protein